MIVLIVDDDPDIRELLRSSIEREGYQVLEAENGKDAELIQVSTPADLLICDLIMPVKEGIETISLFRRDFPNVGIIAISGGGNIGPIHILLLPNNWESGKYSVSPLILHR
jgi:DNA-binding response OmpR family regulator